MRKISAKYFTVLLVLLTAGLVYAAGFQEKEIPAALKGKETISIMTMNAENLFDTEHDEGKLDFPYMPKEIKDKDPKIQQFCAKSPKWAQRSCYETDWTEKLLREKMRRLGEAIQANGSPEIIIFQEVENIKVLDRFRTNFLPTDYIESVLIEGPDRRGIDVAMVSKLPLVEAPRLHNIPFDPPKDTRPILEATFRLPDGKKLTVLGLHFPSQHNSPRYRAFAVEYLNSLLRKYPKDRMVIAAGDSNIVHKEYQFWSEYAPGFVTSNTLGVSGGVGTHYYRGDWSLLDVVLFKKAMTDNQMSWGYVENSAVIANKYKYQYKYVGKGKDKQKVPNAFRSPDYSGVSDHFPLKVKIQKVK